MSVGSEIYVPSPKVAFRIIGGQAVVVHTIEETLITLNETGTAIWERLDGRTVSAISDEIAQQFEVEAGEALKDTSEFLGNMKERGFVEIEQPRSKE